MRNLLTGAVVAVFIVVGAAVALAQQSAQGIDERDTWSGSYDEMHGWMTENSGEMPMHGDDDLSDMWSGSHDEMHGDAYRGMHPSGETRSG